MKTALIISNCVLFTLVVAMCYPLGLLPVMYYSKSVWRIPTKPDGRTYNKGDKVKIFERFNFDEGGYSLCIYMCAEDMHSLRQFSRVRWTDDVSVLNEIKSKLVLNYTRSDMCTPESCLFLLKDGEPVMTIGLAASGCNVGLQSREYGWIEFDNSYTLTEAMQSMSVAYMPVVWL